MGLKRDHLDHAAARAHDADRPSRRNEHALFIEPDRTPRTRADIDLNTAPDGLATSVAIRRNPGFEYKVGARAGLNSSGGSARMIDLRHCSGVRVYRNSTFGTWQEEATASETEACRVEAEAFHDREILVEILAVADDPLDLLRIHGLDRRDEFDRLQGRPRL